MFSFENLHFIILFKIENKLVLLMSIHFIYSRSFTRPGFDVLELAQSLDEFPPNQCLVVKPTISRFELAFANKFTILNTSFCLLAKDFDLSITIRKLGNFKTQAGTSSQYADSGQYGTRHN